MKKIKRFHFIGAVDVGISSKYSLLRNDVGMIFRQTVSSTKILITGIKSELENEYPICSTIGIFKSRKTHVCESCGKVLGKGKYCIGVLNDYHCMPSYWGYNYHLCLSCFCKNTGDQKIVECNRLGCNLENMKGHRTMMLFDLLREQYGFKIVDKSSLTNKSGENE